MKRTAWIFVVLCLVFVLSISAIAATTGGARYRHREHLDTWYDTADDNVPDNGFRTDVDTAYLYGNWYDRDLGFAGAYVSADKGTTLNIVLSSDFDFKRTEEGPWLTLCGGGIANDSEINGSTKVIVNGNRGAKIDLDNGGISIYGGGSHYWNRDNTSNISSAISGDSLVELKGESPEFILDEDERDNFNIYGGSAIGDKDIATTHIIYGGSGIVIESPWDLGDDDRDIGFVIGGSNVSGISKTITKGKTYVVLIMKTRVQQTYEVAEERRITPSVLWKVVANCFSKKVPLATPTQGATFRRTPKHIQRIRMLRFAILTPPVMPWLQAEGFPVQTQTWMILICILSVSSAAIQKSSSNLPRITQAEAYAIYMGVQISGA